MAVSGTNTAVSLDGIAWETHPGPTAVNLRYVVAGNGLFIASAAAGTIAAVSEDGIQWTARNIGYTQFIGFGDEQFVALGTGLVLLSTDGLVWSQVAASLSEFVTPVLAQMAYGNNRYVAVGSSLAAGLIASSPDGIEWTSSSALGLSSEAFHAGVYADNRFTVIGNTYLFSRAPIASEGEASAVLTSETGSTWKTYSVGLRSTSLSGIAYGAGHYVVVGPYSSGCALSDWPQLALVQFALSARFSGRIPGRWTKRRNGCFAQWAALAKDQLRDFELAASGCGRRRHNRGRG